MKPGPVEGVSPIMALGAVSVFRAFERHTSSGRQRTHQSGMSNTQTLEVCIVDVFLESASSRAVICHRIRIPRQVVYDQRGSVNRGPSGGVDTVLHVNQLSPSRSTFASSSLAICVFSVVGVFSDWIFLL